MKFVSLRNGSSRSCAAALSVALVLGVAGGCGVESYETRMATTIEDLKHDNKFVGLDKTYTKLVAPGGEAAVAISPRLRLPVLFGRLAAYTAESADPEKGSERIPTNRLLPPPPLPGIPGFQETFELMIGSKVGTRPWHIYMGVVRHEPGSGGSAAELAKILDAAKAAQPDVPDLAWQDTPVLALRKGDASRVWKTLQIKSPQLFYMRGNEPGDLNGTFTIMVLNVPGKAPIGDHQIVIGSRLVSLANDLQRINEVLAASMGTLEIDPALPAAAPKPN
ncbi:MAG: hypothetical protein K8U03_12415 [Planctomycetia bacterium]|nr:hypothetical protein [Planctomycetia bacterium]